MSDADKLAETLKALREGKSVPCPYCGAEHFTELVFECGTYAHYVCVDHLGFRRSESCYERQLAALAADNERLRTALRQITKCEGPYARDKLTHAGNVIEAMQNVAWDALAERGKEDA